MFRFNIKFMELMAIGELKSMYFIAPESTTADMNLLML